MLDYTKIYKKYKGKWVGLSEDLVRVIASGNTPRAVLNMASKKGIKSPTLFKVPSSEAGFIGSNVEQQKV